jgi:hypothetical protein
MPTLTHKELADYIQEAGNRFMEGRCEAASAMGMRMISELLQVMGLKSPNEGVLAALDRMRAPQMIPMEDAEVSFSGSVDLLNPECRQTFANLVRELFTPLGVNRVMIIGMTVENGEMDSKIFVVQITRDGIPVVQDIRRFFEYLSTGTPGEDLELI